MLKWVRTSERDSNVRISGLWITSLVFCQKDVNEIANSEDPDQTAPLGAVRSGSALFAQTYLSKNFESLQ